MKFEEKIYSVIGKRIRDKRLEARLTQKELAEEVDLTRTSVTSIENGQQKIQIHTLYAIAKVLNTSAIDLLPDVEQEEKTLDERLPQDLREDERDWILSILNPTDK